VNTAKNFQVPQDAGNFLMSFSRRTLLHVFDGSECMYHLTTSNSMVHIMKSKFSPLLRQTEATASEIITGGIRQQQNLRTGAR
jgi:hypothetical protein